MITLIRRILAVSGTYKKRIWLAFVLSFIKSMLAKAPIMLSYYALVRFYEGTADVTLCSILGIAIAGCVIGQVFLQYGADRLQSAAGYLIFADMRMKLGAHLRRMPMGYFTEGNIGKISSVLSNDMIFIEENCMTVLANMMSYIFSEAIMITYLLIFNPWVGLAAAAVIAVAVLIGQGMRKDSLKHAAIRQDQNESMTDAIIEFTEGIGIAKTYNLSGERSKELTESFCKTCHTSIAFEKNQIPWTRALYILYAIGAAVMILIAMLLQNSGAMAVTAAVGVMLFVFDVFGPIKALYSDSSRLTVMNSCLDRIEELFDEKELPDEGKEALTQNPSAPEIEFRDVSFGYTEKEVLSNISFSLDKCHMMALVGPSGGGKSTIANLLARFWDVRSGEIRLRGKDIRNIPMKDLMDQISMVFQRVYLFQDTIYNNIAMGRTDATRQEVEEAAKKARCYDFIMSLPEGFETMIGEGGESLSGGEKQRISIARCILKDAPVIILDEATASVDADNEKYIQEAISELCKGKTIIVIAHRLNTIRNADRILVIADGKISQSGRHEELINVPGIYREFVMTRGRGRGWNRKNKQVIR